MTKPENSSIWQSNVGEQRNPSCTKTETGPPDRGRPERSSSYRASIARVRPFRTPDLHRHPQDACAAKVWFDGPRRRIPGIASTTSLSRTLQYKTLVSESVAEKAIRLHQKPTRHCINEISYKACARLRQILECGPNPHPSWLGQSQSRYVAFQILFPTSRRPCFRWCLVSAPASRPRCRSR